MKITKLLPRRLAISILLLILFVPTSQALADTSSGTTSQDIQSIRNQTPFYDPNAQFGACGNSLVPTAGVTSVNTDQNEAQNAQSIIGIAKTENLGQQGALIALMVGIDESHLTNLANQKVPLSEQNPTKQGDGSNGTSLGVFQQQIVDNWSTISSDINDTNAIAQLMTPAYAAEAFFGSPSGTSAPSALSKGLQNQSNWQSLPPWVAAQAVQRSGTADGSNYEAQEAAAQALLNQYWTSSSPTSLPVPLNVTASPPASGSGSVTAANGCAAGANCTSTTASAASSTPLRQTVVCLAQQELQSWQNGQLQPGQKAYFKYTQNSNEEWCADFISWLYDQAGYPLGTSTNWRIPGVSSIQTIGEKNTSFTYHALGSGYTPLPGDIVIHGSQHTNLVVAVKGSTLTLIGGDQGNGNSSFTNNAVSEYSVSNPASDDPPITGFVSPNQ